MKPRLREFDFVRAFAAMSVIAIHVTAGYTAYTQSGYYWNQAMRYAVPLFIIISGFLLYFAERDRPRLSYAGFLRKRFQKILLPYLIWTALYTAYSNRQHLAQWAVNDPLHPVLLWAKHLVMGTGYVHLYFLLIVLQLYLLYPLLRNWLEKYQTLLVAGSFVLTLFSQTMIYLHQIQVLVLPSLGIPYVSLFPIWLFYFVFGMLAARHKESWEEKLAGKMLQVTLIWLASFALLLVDSRYTKTFASSIKPSIMLFCLASYFLFYLICVQVKETRGKIGKWLDWVALHSFLIFLLHPLLVSLLVALANRSGLTKLWYGTAGMLFLYTTVTLLTVLITYLVSLTPFASLLGGVRTVKRKPQEVTLSGS